MSISLESLFVRPTSRPKLNEGLVPAIIRSKNFPRSWRGRQGESYRYSRVKNPTREELENALARVEGGKYAFAYSSGMAAEDNLFSTLNQGDHVVVPTEVYGDTIKLFKEDFQQRGITFSQSDFSSEKAILAQVKPNTRYLFIETPTNPNLTTIDLSLVQRVSVEHNLPFVADMTFSPPYTTRALDYGALAVIQSLTKYMEGHGDTLGGAIITNSEGLASKLFILQAAKGGVLSPDECYRTIQGMKTLPIRWEKASSNALHIAKYLANHKAISKVHYPGLPDTKGHEIAKRQMKNGFGAVLSFELEDFSNEDKLVAFVEKVQESGIITFAVSLGSIDSLLTHPGTMSHNYLSEDEKKAMGISDGMFRFSAGIENVQDIERSLRDGLSVF